MYVIAQVDEGVGLRAVTFSKLKKTTLTWKCERRRNGHKCSAIEGNGIYRALWVQMTLAVCCFPYTVVEAILSVG